MRFNLVELERLTSQIGHNIGLRAPIHIQKAWSLSSVYYTARVGSYRAEKHVRKCAERMSRSLDLLDLGVSERAREVLLVGENQQRRPGQPLLAE